MITLFTVSLLLILTFGAVLFIHSNKSIKKGNAETWEKLMMSRLNK